MTGRDRIDFEPRAAGVSRQHDGDVPDKPDPANRPSEEQGEAFDKLLKGKPGDGKTSPQDGPAGEPPADHDLPRPFGPLRGKAPPDHKHPSQAAGPGGEQAANLHRRGDEDSELEKAALGTAGDQIRGKAPSHHNHPSRAAGPGGEQAANLHRRGDEESELDKAASGAVGDQILRGMPPLAQPTVGGPEPTQADKADLSEAIEKLADQILVSTPDADKSEVRVRLKSEILEGAELSISRDANGLSIKFETSSFDVAQRVEGMREQLQQHMEKRSSDPVHISVDVQNEQQDQNPGDGRSRNRRDPWEERDEGDAE